MRSSNTPAGQADLLDLFKSAMRRLASTVTIVSCNGPQGRSGMTATAVTSLTADPPAVLACVNRSASIHASLHMHSPFCINLLSPDHADLSFAFGGRVAPEERFAQGDWADDEGGTPYLLDAQSNLFCTVDAMLDYGTHTIFVGRVARVRNHGEVRPLVYGNGRFIPV
jgi:flavin reductase (DIM6/NTAB) family NADH-FMN oxidoreductase RutF